MADAKHKNLFERQIDKIIGAMESTVEIFPEMMRDVMRSWLICFIQRLYKTWLNSLAYNALQNLCIGVNNLYYDLADGCFAVIATMDKVVAKSCVGGYFLLEGSGVPQARPGARFSLEIGAGLTTFCAMAYIISVRPL